MKSFITRAISALIAVAGCFALYHYLHASGLKVLTIIAVVLGSRELIQILFKPEESKSLKVIFYLFSLCVYSLSTLHPNHAAIFFAFFSICFCLVSLLTFRKLGNLTYLSQTQAKGVMGFFYIGLLPSFAAQILDIRNGVYWFITLLVIVFAGDICAYIVGVLFGRHKIMPTVSPKKSVEGAIGGLVGSIVAGAVCLQFLPHVTIFHMVILTLAAAVVAQFGDFFESLLKRVADVKDSGKLMPGHGGVLDRIDGVLFASPIILFGAVLLEKLL